MSKTVKEYKVYSFSVRYDPREDRLRLVINRDEIGQRVDFWITRRFLFSMMMEAEPFLEKYGIAGEDTEQETHLSGDAPSSTTQADRTGDGLSGGSEEREKEGVPDTRYDAVLLEKVSMSYDRKRRRSLLEMEGEGQRAVSALTLTELHTFFRILTRQVPVREWGLPAFR